MKKHDQGSAIITVLVFLTIVLLFISILVVYQRSQYKQITRLADQIQTHFNTRSVLTLALKDYQKSLNQKDYSAKTFVYSLFKKDSTFVRFEPWGYFIRCFSRSKIKQSECERTFLIGCRLKKLSKFALVLGNIRNPLVVAGNTLIMGDAAVGMQGVKTGILKGRRHKGRVPVMGAVVKNPTSLLPEVNFELLYYQQKMLRNRSSRSIISEPIAADNRLLLNNGTCVFSQETLIDLHEQGVTEIVGPGTLYMNSDINFNAINLLDQITIFSEKSVNFFNGTNSEHILVFAKNIMIHGFNRLRGQFFATDKFIIDNGARLQYPSIVGLISKKVWAGDNIFTIGKNVEIEGSILLANDLAAHLPYKKHKLLLDQTSYTKGICYSDNYTELNGLVHGSVMTETFHFYLSPTIYVNWIKDSEVNRPALSANFYYPVSFRNYGELSVIGEL